MYQDLTSIPVIDSHVHAFPERIARAVRRWFYEHAWHFRYQGSAQEMIELQLEQGAAGIVLLTYAHREGIAEDLNRFIGELARRFPQTAGFGTVHPRDHNVCDIVRMAFERHGLCGIKLHCHVLKMPPDAPELFPVYETVLEQGKLLLIHAGREPAIDAYGMDVRTITGVRRVERVLDRYPQLKLIIPHMGFDETDQFFMLMDRYPQLYLDTTMVMGDHFKVRIDREKMIEHGDRILYGSDFPHIPYEMETEVRAILKMGLGEAVTRKILFENAAKLFPLTVQSTG